MRKSIILTGNEKWANKIVDEDINELEYKSVKSTKITPSGWIKTVGEETYIWYKSFNENQFRGMSIDKIYIDIDNGLIDEIEGVSKILLSNQKLEFIFFDSLHDDDEISIPFMDLGRLISKLQIIKLFFGNIRVNISSDYGIVTPLNNIEVRIDNERGTTMCV